MITKDRDFEISHLLQRTPKRLLLVTTGNISNNDLLNLSSSNIEAIAEALGDNDYVELSSSVVVIHRTTRDQRPRLGPQRGLSPTRSSATVGSRRPIRANDSNA